MREALWTSGYNTASAGYTFIKTINKVRLSAVAKDTSYIGYKAYPIFSDTHVVAMKKSTIVGVFSNIGASGTGYSITLPAGAFTNGVALTEVVSCTTYTATSTGGLTFNIGRSPSVFYPTASLTGTGLCGTTSTGKSILFSALSMPQTLGVVLFGTSTATFTGGDRGGGSPNTEIHFPLNMNRDVLCWQVLADTKYGRQAVPRSQLSSPSWLPPLSVNLSNCMILFLPDLHQPFSPLPRFLSLYPLYPELEKKERRLKQKINPDPAVSLPSGAGTAATL